MKKIMTATIFTLCTFVVRADAAAEVVIIVHPDSKMTSISQRELKRVFLGKSQRLVGYDQKVNAINLPSNHNSHSIFSMEILNKSTQQMRSYWVNLIFSGKATAPLIAKDSDEMKKMVSSNPQAIGYIDSDYIDPSVKVIEILP